MKTTGIEPATSWLQQVDCPTSADLDRHDRHLAEHADDGQKCLERGDAVETRFGELDVDGVDLGLVIGSVDGHPAAVDVDLVPEVEAESAERFDVDQANNDTGRHSRGAAHGGGQHAVFGAVAGEVGARPRWRGRTRP